MSDTTSGQRPARRTGSAARTRPAGRTRPTHGPGARRPAAAATAPRVPFAVLLVGLVLGGMALLLVLNTASAANELSRHAYAEQDTVVGAQVQQLRNEVAASSAPENLARAAAALGMVPAGNPAFLVVGPGGTVVVRGSAAPASAVVVAVPRPPKKPTPAPTATPAATATPSGTATPGAKPSGTPSGAPKPSPTPAPSTPAVNATTVGGTR